MLLGLKESGIVQLHLSLHGLSCTVDQRIIIVVDIVPPRFLLCLDFLNALFGESEFLCQTVNNGLVIVLHTQLLGQFAANEQCTIVGLKLRAIENVRILGPVRKVSQVEISATDARTLGVNAPLRESGDVAGSAPVALAGPKGVLYLKEGCIVAARHIHMTPQEAGAAGLKDGDYVSVRMGNERGAVLDKVKIRVDPSFSLEMHIDTDEANACQVKQGDIAEIL